MPPGQYIWHFFRYFSSKNDLLAQGVVGFGDSLAAAIRACPPSDTLAQVFRKTVLHAARQSAALPRTREIMRIAAADPAARAAQLSRIAELQDRVAGAFARRRRNRSAAGPTPEILAASLLSVLSVTFRLWFERGRQDISATVDQVFATFACLVCEDPPAAPRARAKPARP